METFPGFIRFMLFSIFTLAFGRALQTEPCKSPQYIEISTTAIIRCNFEENAFAILWYNSTDYSGRPIFNFREGVKSGVGFGSGEFDIMNGGSLIISNVSLRHDHYFTVVKLNGPNDDFIPHTVLAIVTVTPNVTHPHISKCPFGRNTCYVELNANENISCAIRDSRPAIPLQWMSRTADSDINVTCTASSSSQGIISSTFAVASDIFSNHQDLILLVCKATRNISVLSSHESVILAQNKKSKSLLSSPVIQTFRYATKVKLTCSNGNSSFLIWKIKSGEKNSEVPLAIFLNKENITESFVAGYEIDNEGSLIIPSLKIHQEGIYRCLYGNGLVCGSKSYRLSVYVPPSPLHPVIDGCLQRETCILKKGSEGSLTCRLLGIRPEARLEWYVFPRWMSSIVTFSGHSREKRDKDGLFDMALTANYRRNDESYNRVFLGCEGSIGNGSLFQLSTKLELFFVDGSTSLQTESTKTMTTNLAFNHASWITPIATIFVLALALVPAFVWLFMRRGDKDILAEKKGVFIKEIRARYEEWCAAVKPVPFLPHPLCNIEDVFVHGGIEALHSNQLDRENWESLNSYRDIFTKPKLRSKRYILEAAAGYGKSTLCLQLVYDWCNDERVFRINKFDVLIFLRLIQVGEDVSIFQAIKHLLLPHDSQLTEGDLRSILQSCESVLMVLDGYDEYIENCTKMETIITNIMKRDTFQSFTVVLTTRPSCMPKEFAPRTKQVRLIGFDETVRDQYIDKVVYNTAYSNIQLVKGRLSENPVLKDLCQIPMFFVMFAHLCHEKDEFKRFISITNFFRYSMKCIHAHWGNKFPTKYSSQEVNDHCKLGKLAFDSLVTEQKQTVWTKESIIHEIGKDCFQKYVSLGLLRVEFFTLLDELEVSQDEHIKKIEKVRFCHDVFREWYAAHHLAYTASEKSAEDLNSLLKHHHQLQLEYMFRFACGLNPAAGDRIIHYFNQIGMPKEIVILCVVEKNGAYTNIIDTIKQLCSDDIDIKRGDSRMMQRAAARLLEIAHQSKVTIPCLRFWNCFTSVHGELRNPENDIRKILPILKGIHRVQIFEKEVKIAGSCVEMILSYVSTCKELKVISFFNCLMPMSFNTSQSLDFEVSWYTLAGEWYTYDFTSNQWKEEMKTKKGLNDATYMNESKYEEMIQLLEADNECEEDLEQSQNNDAVPFKRSHVRRS